MTSETTTVLRCDAPGCATAFTSDESTVHARIDADRQGWRKRYEFAGILDYCPEHRAASR